MIENLSFDKFSIIPKTNQKFKNMTTQDFDKIIQKRRSVRI